MTGEDVIAEAREWLGTPFQWQASLKGVGCDCKGLIWGVARALGLPEAAAAYASVADYSSKVPIHLLRKGLAETLQPVETPEPGDVLLMRMAGRPQHLGFFAGKHVIHTYSRGPASMVIPTPIETAFRAWPLAAVYRFPSLVA